MTIKELQKILTKEKYDLTHTPAYIVIEGERYEVEAVDLYDDEVHIKVGEPVEKRAEDIIDMPDEVLA